MNKRDCTFGAALCAAQLLAASHALANNIQVSGVTLQSIDTTADTAMVQFNLSWENSWRVTTGPANYDAAWVFVKYHTGDQLWKTASLDITDAMHSVPVSATLDMGVNGSRGLGAFIYRSAPGSGNVNFTSIRLKWNYGTDGVSDAALITLDVHAIEMVYVPSGAFQVGDGGARAGAADTVATLSNGNTPAPFTVTSAGPLNVGVAAGSLGASGLPNGTYKQVPATFPTGFDAYYMMKYEGSQGQWAAFMNTTVKFPAIPYLYYEALQPYVTVPPQVPPRDFLAGRQVFFSADLPPPSVLPGPIPPNPVPTVPTRPIVQAKTPDRAFFGGGITTTPATSPETAALAYLDWSGLRPMTEFEYEKAARGPVAPVNGEYAWGTADVALLTYGNTTASQSTLSNDGLSNEGPVQNYNEAGGNAWTRPTMLTLPAGGPVLGPARVGMFAKPTYNPPTPPRIQSGAGFYGIMDLTGNVAEVVARWTFPLGTSTATLFTAENGDGALGANGQANVAGWTAAAGATFFGLRGGSFAEAPTPVSVRSAITGATATITNPGIRGVRSAPVSTP